MILEVYSVVFWVFAIVSTYLQDKAVTGEKKLMSMTTLVKLIPALSAVVFVILLRIPTPFTILLAAALVFCMFGDVGMEADLVPGIGMFLIAHILYTTNFLWTSATTGLLMVPSLLSGGCVILGVIYVIWLIRYLRSSGPEIPPFILRAGSLYFILVAATIGTSVLLWQTSSIGLGLLPVIGALFFILSDSLIGINAFHHDITHHELYIMLTYYLAIFLLSLGAFVFPF
jgi:uncharacterized membrane protein YhhN